MFFHLCRCCGAGEILTAVTGMRTPLPLDALAEVVLYRHQEAQKRLYGLELLWLAGVQQFTLAGGRDYPMPEPMMLFGPEHPQDQRGAEEIRKETLEKLAIRKDVNNGQAV